MIAFAFIVLLLLYAIWHLLSPIAIIAITGGLGSILVAVVVLFCVAIVLIFVMTGVGIVVLGATAFVGGIILAAFFPMLFPIIIPLLITLALIAAIRRKQDTKKTETVKLNHSPKDWDK